jgi:hypothetical protein
MPEFGDLFALAVLAFWAYCIFDVIRTPDGTTENLPKMLWLVIVIFLSAIGGLAWLLLGRPRNASFNLRANTYRSEALPPQAPSAPPPVQNNDEYQRKREDALRRYHAQREEELRKKEEELRRREDELRKREQGTSGSS